MATSSSKRPVDVFISYSKEDKHLAERVAHELEKQDMSVFIDAEGLQLGSLWEKQIWNAIAESRAMVVINPNIPKNGWQGIEVGAASAWSKPMFCVKSPEYQEEIPTSILRDVPTFSSEQLTELADAVKDSAQPFTEEETVLLLDSYAKLGAPVDVLTTQPPLLEKLTRNFASKSPRSVSGEQLLTKLLRLRKQGRLKAKP